MGEISKHEQETPRLDREAIEQALQTAKETGSKLKLTLRRDAVEEVPYLVGMVDNILKVDNSTQATLLAIMSSRDWGHDNNRVVEVSLLPTFDQKWFMDRLGRALENLEVV